MNSKKIRDRIIRIAYEEKFSHVGSCLSCVEILINIFGNMKDGDKFVLSAGHKALALYSVLVEKGLMSEDEMRKMPGHPNRDDKLGIYCSTGSLGMGLSVGIGLAIASQAHHVYVLLSDGDMDEGSTYEGMKFIAEHDVKNISVILDSNGWQAYKKPSTNMVLPKVVRTVKGNGLKRFENQLGSHYWKIEKEDYEEYIRLNSAQADGEK